MLNKTIVKLSSLALALSISPSILAETNELITNGSFENFSISKDNGRWKLVQFDGWQGEGEVWTAGLGKAATDGKYKIELDVGREVNTLSQSVATIAGQKYHLSLDAYARRSRSSDFEILVDGEVIASIRPDRKWQRYDAYFIGTGSAQTIAIKEIDAQSNGLGTIIDNVSLKASNELLSNGSFEEFTVTKNNGRWKLVTFKDWQGAGEVWTNRLGKRSTAGAYKIELDVGREVNSLSQSVSTEAGLYYLLSLDAYARRKNSSDFEIWLDNEKIETIKPSGDWKRYSVKLLGNGTTQTISIREIDSQSNGLGTVIDNVSLVSTGEYLNAAPIISGTPATNVSTGEAYSFLPTASDANADDTLVFSINNKPDWASFNPVTGELSGIPSNESITDNIVISVSDGTETVSLAPFSVKASTPVNLAYKYGRATQGDIWDRRYANNAIDNDPKTYNHANDVPPNNWWQLELPEGTKISKIVIHNSTYRPYRLKNAKMYLNKKPHVAGSSDMGNLNQTLSADGVQTFTYDTPVDARYVLMQGNLDPKNSLSLHMGEVEVYGIAPSAPSFTEHKKNYEIQSDTDIGSTIASLGAVDYQGDKLSYRIIGDMPFSIDSNGNITISRALTASHYDIVVEVSDGTHSKQTTLSLDVVVNVARKYGKVTQPPRNGYYYYSAPENVLDGNTNTYNHTQCTAGENWLQVALPSPTSISKIMIQGRASNTGRLQGATAYISSTPYTGTLNASDKVATLAGTAQRQETAFSTPKSGSYLIIKASGSNCLHLAEVEVYGEAPATPSFNAHEKNYLIPGATAVGSTLASLSAIDYQGDTLSYRIVGDVPFSVDAQGKITVSEALQARTYHIVVEVSDGTHSSQTTLTVQVTSSNAVSDAIKSGDVSNVTEQELIQATIDEVISLKAGNSLLSNIYQDGSISYTTGGYYSQLINLSGDIKKTFPILYGNKNNVLAVAGTKQKSRFSIFASNPLFFFDKGENLAYEPYMKRILAWLIAGKANDAMLKDNKKTIALTFEKSGAVSRWIKENYPKWEVKSCHDKLTLASCSSDADLIILGKSGSNADADALKGALPAMLADAKPILYLHPNWGQNSLSQVVADQFEFSFPYGGNYWASDAANWSNSKAMQASLYAKSGYGSIHKMMQHFQSNDYGFNWSQCNGENCSSVTGLNSDFTEGAKLVYDLMHGLDSQKKNIFKVDGYHLQKLLALTGDKFRQAISFPMDKVTTDDTEFMKSYYADYAVYNSRDINPVQTDMGNFSRSNFSHITPTSRTVSLTTKNGFRSTGAYALPGQTVRVTRNDHSDVTVKVFINTLRSGSTHQWANNGYKRPKFLQSQHMEIKSGETISFTSPYGGPLQLSFNKKDMPVSFNFQNIGEHAYWSSPADNASFAKKLVDNEFEWAEVATAGFEVHSKLDKMVKSVSSEQWGSTAEGLANAVVKYTSNYPHVLAGFKGEGVDIVPEIHDWAKAKGLTIETIDKMKHMNADQATCGYGCSGNPYDAYWAFNPIGHGDIHEMGHSMQKMRFEGFPNHAATNTFSYYTKSKYFANTGGEPSCQGLPFNSFFDKVQGAVGKADVAAYLKTNLWDKAGLGEQYLLKIQAMMHAQKMGKLENGWHVLARVHILEREMRRAKQDWENRKESVGFSNYTLNEIKSIGNNDWLVVAYSYAAGLDYRNYFDMMGIPFTQKARDQIASFGFDVVPNELFVSTSKGYCKQDEYGRLFDRPTLSIDGKTAYPY